MYLANTFEDAPKRFQNGSRHSQGELNLSTPFPSASVTEHVFNKNWSQSSPGPPGHRARKNQGILTDRMAASAGKSLNSRSQPKRSWTHQNPITMNLQSERSFDILGHSILFIFWMVPLSTWVHMNFKNVTNECNLKGSGGHLGASEACWVLLGVQKASRDVHCQHGS